MIRTFAYKVIDDKCPSNELFISIFNPFLDKLGADRYLTYPSKTNIFEFEDGAVVCEFDNNAENTIELNRKMYNGVIRCLGFPKESKNYPHIEEKLIEVSENEHFELTQVSEEPIQKGRK